MATPTSTSLDPALVLLADSMVGALERGDVDAWGEAFAPGAVTWHSYSGSEISAVENVELLRGLLSFVVSELRYEQLRRHGFDGGFVQQYQLVMTAHAGARYETGACQVIHVSDGRITRMEEYLDSSVLQFGADNAPAPPA